MTIYNPEGTHEKYTQTDRHWCPQSEKTYTGADSLLTAQRNGWRLLGIAYRQDILLRGSRYTTLYYFKLFKDGKRVIMPVLSNPFVARMVKQQRIRVESLPQQQAESLDETVEAPRVAVLARA